MGFTDRQKDIIRKIRSGEIYDISSFVSAYQLSTTVRYDRSRAEEAFRQDAEAEACYYPKNLAPTPANRIGEETFQARREAGSLDPAGYARLEPALCDAGARQEETVFDRAFTFDFYEGVRILTDFEALVDFLSIWQYLKEGSMVLDVAQPLDEKTVGLFFEPSNPEIPAPEAAEDSGILQFSDRRYLEPYRLSEKYLQICRDFLGRRIYPAPKLNLFIQNNFFTQEEKQQSYALFAAWAAIAVSVVIAVIQCLPG